MRQNNYRAPSCRCPLPPNPLPPPPFPCARGCLLPALALLLFYLHLISRIISVAKCTRDETSSALAQHESHQRRYRYRCGYSRYRDRGSYRYRCISSYKYICIYRGSQSYRHTDTETAKIQVKIQIQTQIQPQMQSFSYRYICHNGQRVLCSKLCAFCCCFCCCCRFIHKIMRRSQ